MEQTMDETQSSGRTDEPMLADQGRVPTPEDYAIADTIMQQRGFTDPAVREELAWMSSGLTVTTAPESAELREDGA